MFALSDWTQIAVTRIHHSYSMPRYFCPNVLFRKPEQWYPTMRLIQRWELGGNGLNKRQPIWSIEQSPTLFNIQYNPWLIQPSELY